MAKIVAAAGSESTNALLCERFFTVIKHIRAPAADHALFAERRGRDLIASGVECPVVLICRPPSCCPSTF